MNQVQTRVYGIDSGAGFLAQPNSWIEAAHAAN